MVRLRRPQPTTVSVARRTSQVARAISPHGSHLQFSHRRLINVLRCVCHDDEERPQCGQSHPCGVDISKPFRFPNLISHVAFPYRRSALNLKVSILCDHGLAQTLVGLASFMLFSSLSILHDCTRTISIGQPHKSSRRHTLT